MYNKAYIATEMVKILPELSCLVINFCDLYY